jgi:anthranilate synthase/aminodeoxychorismate synthase-like glutamine amidotransferase
MIVLIDNYDSFTYNLYDYFRQLALSVVVVKNDRYSVEDIAALNPSAIILSPGPGRPEDAGITLAAINHFAGKVPLLGICLGHQAIAQAFGAAIIKAPQPVHGKTALISHDGRTLFQHLANPLTVMRYHSLIVDSLSLPAQFDISATTAEGLIMAMRHKTLAIESVQFHPEAILTESGLTLLKQFIMTYTKEHLGQ